MGEVQILPGALVAGFAVACKFFVDLARRIYWRLRRRRLPGWAKQAISVLVACVVVLQARIDFFASLRGETTLTGMLLTGVVLAGLASEVVHPAVEAAKAAGEKIKGRE